MNYGSSLSLFYSWRNWGFQMLSYLLRYLTEPKTNQPTSKTVLTSTWLSLIPLSSSHTHECTEHGIPLTPSHWQGGPMPRKPDVQGDWRQLGAQVVFQMRRSLSIRCHLWSADASTITQGRANSRDNGPKCFLDRQRVLPNSCWRHLDWEQKPKLRQHSLILPQSGPRLLSSLFSNLNYCKKPCLAA